jgi:CheY-like chemotaxis protein
LREYYLLSILLIDDEPALLEMLVQIAQRSREVTILPAQSAKEALNALSEQSFDVIITDCRLPDMGGIDLIRRIRSENDITPIILYCEAPNDRMLAEALNSGASYFLQKEKDPRRQFQEIVKVAGHVSSRSIGSHSVRIASKVISDLVGFSSDPCFAIDRTGTVIAWNDSMEQLSDVSAGSVIGKGDYIYAEPFHGLRRKVLADLVFAPDEEIKNENYMLVSRVKNGPVIAVTRGTKKDGSAWTLWSKAMPVFDPLGNFVAVVCTIRDVTSTFGDIVTPEPRGQVPAEKTADPKKAGKKGGKKFLNRLMNSAMSHYKDGITLYFAKDYKGAIAAFDRAIAIDDTLPYIWNDRGMAFRETGDYSSALKSCLRAVELAPESPQCLFTLGETLEKIGIMYMSSKYLDSAVQTFRMVVNLLPNNADAWSHIGNCYREMGDTDQSKFHHDRARDIRMGGKDTPISYTRDDYRQ